jgi:hypothetical protein
VSIDLTGVVDLRDVENGLRRMQLAGHNLLPVFRAARKAVRADMRDHAKQEKAPDRSWPSLAASTVRNRQARTGKQGRKRKRPARRSVRKLGRLPAAFKIEITPMSLRATSRVKWSGVHQDGTARVPERRFLWASPRLLRIIADKAADHLVGALQGRP